MDPGERHTILYKRFIIKCQRLNALIYTFGAFIFVVGSVFFMPQMEGIIPNKGIHGCWLFIAGSAVYMCGAYLGVKTARELTITATKHTYKFEESERRCRHLWWLTDEQASFLRNAV